MRAMSASDSCVRCRMFKSRIVARMAFSAEGLTAGCEAAEQFLVPRAPDQPRPEAVSEEVKLDVRILPFALSVLAVDDLGFRRMHLQAALRQASLKLGLEGFGFLLGPAVHQPVIRIPTPREVGVCPRHPEIERVVQEEI